MEMGDVIYMTSDDEKWSKRRLNDLMSATDEPSIPSVSKETQFSSLMCYCGQRMDVPSHGTVCCI